MNGLHTGNQCSSDVRDCYLTQTAMFVALEASDIISLARKRMSVAQYMKKMLSVLTSMALSATGTYLAGLGVSYLGAKTGKEINIKIGGPVGAVCGFAGGTLGTAVVKVIGNQIREDDAVITTRMFNSCIINLAVEYLMSEEEMATVVSILDGEGKKLTKVQKDMISSDNQYACCDAFLRPIFKKAIANRAKIVRQDE